MANCPHAKGHYGCNALIDYGFAQNTLVLPENWWKQYCKGKNYRQCPNLKTAANMQEDCLRQDKSGIAPCNGSSDQKIKLINKVFKTEKKPGPCPWR
ncbi:hypothetical protein Dred_0167 [Desulforamulus reducens MI-1]|uniref:Uncharacterized protein n=1 Tax=Desulforamulus reducens (strain ATCC BAA-1160 / DSM 100696 / MI-1) TaxID=349161 RepID=A4J0W3_DESRM|nr:hypothetical protein [Desulforamulus reducens]ABO48716.1 hypothetical protein Dred_0167 [Desulforamulus reducens MI-1]